MSGPIDLVTIFDALSEILNSRWVKVTMELENGSYYTLVPTWKMEEVKDK